MSNITIEENGLKIEADALRLKIIAEALTEYMYKHHLTGDTTLKDWRFGMEKAYQEHHKLHKDDWEYTPEDHIKVISKGVINDIDADSHAREERY